MGCSRCHAIETAIDLDEAAKTQLLTAIILKELAVRLFGNEDAVERLMMKAMDESEFIS